MVSHDEQPDERIDEQRCAATAAPAAEGECFDVYVDEDGNEFIVVDGERVMLADLEEGFVEEVTDEDDDVDDDANAADEDEADGDDEDDVSAADEDEDAAAEPASEDASDEEVYDVYVDEDGNEFVVIDGERVMLDDLAFEEVEAEEDEPVREVDPDDPSYNPLAYDNVQAATDVANDFARASGSVVREGAALASELKEAVDDISSMLDVKSWLK